MIKRLFVLLLVLPILACGGLSTSLPSTPTSAAGSQTSAPPTSIPPTSAPAQSPPTATPPAITSPSFPDPNLYTWKEIVSGLQRPVDLQPDNSGKLFVLEKAGRIRIISNDQLLSDPFLDITDRVSSLGNEQGLLGLAFHPNYSQSGYFYINYTGRGGTTFISRFHASDNVADAGSELNLLKVDQPFANHNGGVLVFGPDGFLYAGLGDGGSQGDPFGNGQSLSTLLGKILRIDVDSPEGEPYAIPPDNPFGNEILYYGLRNPWRISFDKLTGDLYIADVGQGDWEEIDFVPAGSPGGLNFGWNYYEGNHDYENNGATGDFVFPVAEYSHAEGGCSVTGGYIYRGSMPEWNGVYLYGDYCTGYVWGLIHAQDGSWQTQRLFETNQRITSFGRNEAGDIYLLSDGGSIFLLARK